jgi:alkylation response protein AidB-like acyl-CoA dehydrogenase
MSDTATTAPDTERAEAFRAKAREWLAANVPRRASKRGDDFEHEMLEMTSRNETATIARAKDTQARLFDAGLAALSWPQEYGGQGLPARFQQILNDELAGYDVPTGIFAIGHGMCAPTVLTHGTAAQKDRYLRPLLRGDEVWCQLFSEPGAGSDVASLQARAVRDGDEWVLSGQKVWTSGAHYSDFGIVIARTNAEVPKHRGITMFILDMHAPGVIVRPLRQITGDANFNEVFFDDVRIPDTMRLGDEGDGWRAAITTLMNERVAIGAGGGGGRRLGVDALIRLARTHDRAGDPVVRQGIVDVWIQQRILGFIGQRIQAAVRAGKVPGPEGSIAKLAGALLAVRSADVGMAIAGVGASAWEPDDARQASWSTRVVAAPAAGIAGGTNEVQRNIIGERVLGLPKEPQVDRDIPFRDLLVGTQRPS